MGKQRLKEDKRNWFQKYVERSNILNKIGFWELLNIEELSFMTYIEEQSK